MLKKTVTYTDYNGSERTEDFYFNLTKAEIMEMELSTSGGLAEMLRRSSRFSRSLCSRLMVKRARTVSGSSSPKKFLPLSLRLRLILKFSWSWLPILMRLLLSSTVSFRMSISKRLHRWPLLSIKYENNGGVRNASNYNT